MNTTNFSSRILALSPTSQQALVKHPDLRKLVEGLIEIVKDQQQTIEVLRAEVKRLQGQLKLDSHNSSKPPSSDKGKKKKLVNLRKDTDRKPGGQKGHSGSTLQSVSNPNHIKKHPAAACSCCGKELSSTPVIEIEKRQVFDIPPLKL
ncbi:hypothetical protein KJ640_07620 [bacterium]|nr:hypothetical protein [bacterium]